MKYSGNCVIEVLKNWGWNPGEFEEVVQKLAEHEKCISHATAEIYDGHISYVLELTPKGMKLYGAWCKKYGYASALEGKLENILVFEDDDISSIGESMKMLRENMKKLS